MCIGVFILGLKRKGKKNITIIDSIFLILAFIALVFWLFAKQPIISTLLITAIDLLGFAPTIRKSWNKLQTETLSFYLLNTFRFALAVIALNRYTIITALYPIAWMTANGLFAAMLMIRRRQVERLR